MGYCKKTGLIGFDLFTNIFLSKPGLPGNVLHNACNLLAKLIDRGPLAVPGQMV